MLDYLSNCPAKSNTNKNSKTLADKDMVEKNTDTDNVGYKQFKITWFIMSHVKKLVIFIIEILIVLKTHLYVYR